jgi:hypothetical protein
LGDVIVVFNDIKQKVNNYLVNIEDLKMTFNLNSNNIFSVSNSYIPDIFYDADCCQLRSHSHSHSSFFAQSTLNCCFGGDEYPSSIISLFKQKKFEDSIFKLYKWAITCRLDNSYERYKPLIGKNFFKGGVYKFNTGRKKYERITSYVDIYENAGYTSFNEFHFKSECIIAKDLYGFK